VGSGGYGDRVEGWRDGRKVGRYAELKTLKPEFVKVAHDTAPSGEMFAQEIRVEAMKFIEIDFK
jgi:hypothetical protein